MIVITTPTGTIGHQVLENVLGAGEAAYVGFTRPACDAIQSQGARPARIGDGGASTLTPPALDGHPYSSGRRRP